MNALETKFTGGGHSDQHKIEKIEPRPAFVIKTRTFSSYGGKRPGTKLFINLCTHPIVPLPKDPDGTETTQFDPEKTYRLIMNNQWEIPILTSEGIRDGRDKKGLPSLIVDCVINDKPMEWCLANQNLKMILIDWCFDAVEYRVGDGFMIDRDTIALPKRSYMGELAPIEVDVDAIDNDSKEVKQLIDKMSEDNPANLLDAKRMADETDEIQELKTSQEPLSAPLIQEIGEMSISSPEHKSTATDKAIRFTVTFRKIDSGLFDYLLEVNSELKDGSEYRVQYDRTQQELLISAPSHAKSVDVTFPLPATTKGQFRVFYLKPHLTLYIFAR